MSDRERPVAYACGEVPPGRYAQQQRAGIVWVRLCAPCTGFAYTTDPGYDGYLSGRCQGCGTNDRELHKFRAFIDSAEGCNLDSCAGRHDRVYGDQAAVERAVSDEMIERGARAVALLEMNGGRSLKQTTRDAATAVLRAALEVPDGQ